MAYKAIIEGNWHQIKGKARETWGQLTDNDIEEINGRSEALIGKIQVRCGKTAEEAEKVVKEWATKFEDL